MSTSRDVLCEGLLAALEDLDSLLTSEDGRDIFDVKTDATSSEAHNELRRLRRSLDQYTEKSSALLYVGFVGHFSAGKSSTVNSILQESGTVASRLTGLHPTDKAVTLVTHSKNSKSLIGAHKRGELEVGSSLVDAALLETSVIVDTPGSGDPSVVEEMVRDFLPICDRLIYTFSAAIPLDKSDLPALAKIHTDLPFLPVRFIITRADEFRANRNEILSSSNCDRAKMDTFVGELISRVAAAIPGFSLAQEDVLLIDNEVEFQTDRLREFVFPAAARDSTAAGHLHSHKVDYYLRSAKEVRNFFVTYLNEKRSALATLIDTAQTNRSHYQEAVTMANNRLTESWYSQQQVLRSKQKGHTEWVTKLEPEVQLGSTLHLTEPIGTHITEFKQGSRSWATGVADTMRQAITETLIAEFDAYIVDCRNRVVRSQKAETLALTPLSVDPNTCTELFDKDIPRAFIADRLERLPKLAETIIVDYLSEIADGADRLIDSIRERRVVTSLSETVEESVSQIQELVAGFFKHVQLYRSGVVSMNARELAQRAGVVEAIDAAELLEVPDEKKETWAQRTVGEIFPNRHEILQAAAAELSKLHERLSALRSRCQAAPRGLSSAVDARAIVREEFRSVSRSDNKDVLTILQRIVAAFNQVSVDVFQRIRDRREELLEERRALLRRKVETLVRRRARKLILFAAIGSAAGLLGYLAVVLWKQPFAGNWAAVVGVGVLANAITSFFTFGLGWLSDSSKEAVDDANDQYIQQTGVIVDEILRENRQIDVSRFFTYRDRQEIEDLFSEKWRQATQKSVERLVVQPFDKAFEQLTSCAGDYRECRAEYIRTVDRLTKELTALFSRVEQNLKALEQVSAEIREEAIVPSFSMFERRSEVLTSELAALTSIELS